MNSNRDDWQGFESFAQENIRYSAQQEIRKASQVQIVPEIKIKITPNPTKSSSISQTKRIINFKSKNSRKFSNLHTEQPKRVIQKKEAQFLKDQKQISTYFDHPVRKITITQPKDQIIPIFRFPSTLQGGKLIYKGLLAKSVQEHFSVLQNDQLRGSCQTVQTFQGQQDELTFDSKFESGNLESVRKIGNEYHLYLAPDTNTKGHLQWFYFTLSSSKTMKVRLIIHHFKKKLSLFQSGMRPYGKKLEEGVEDWRPIGFNIKYAKQQAGANDIRQKNASKLQNPLYFLGFQLQVQANSIYCVASCIPYTYNYLKSQLQELQANSMNIICCEESVLCKSLSGLDIPLLTVNSQIEKQKEDRKYVVINARSHPGETSSSWVVQGIIQCLLTNQSAQNILKQGKLVVKIVPMLNPDGVYMGNYRTGVMGIDFNRLFLTGKTDYFPQIEGLRQLVRACKTEANVSLYMDLHGHSILPGCFIYGPDPIFSPSSQLKKFQMQLKNSRYFASKHCISGQLNSKTETSRVYFQIQQGLYSLTCESSLGLFYSDAEKSKKQQFRSNDWKLFGKQLIMAILKEYEKNQSPSCDDHLFFNFKNQEKYDAFQDLQSIKKVKTDSEDLQNHIRLLNQLETDKITIQRQCIISKSIPQQIQSLNDSDNQSQDLSPLKRQELFTYVKKVLEKRQINEATINQTTKRQHLKSKQKKSIEKGQTFMNFKQYRFGHQQSTLADWHMRKRLLSIPRVLKSQKINQSYIIRKSVPKPFSSELIFQSMQGNKKIKTECREQNRKKLNSRLLYLNNSEMNKEKSLMQHYYVKRI